MKKLMSVILVMAMLLSMTAIFASCSGGPEGIVTDPEEIKKNPVKYLGDSFNNAAEIFAGDDAGINEIVAGAFNGGSVNVKWDAPASLIAMYGMPQLGIDETLYFGKDMSSLVSDTKVNVAGEQYTAMLYVTTSLMAIGGNILGGDTYKVDVFNFAEEFADSALAELAGEEFTEMYTEMLGQMEAYLAQMEGQANQTMEEYQKRLSRYLSALKQTVTASGDSIVVSYVIDSAAIEALMKEVVKDIPDADTKAMIESTLPQLKATVDMVGLSLKLDINVSTKTGAVSSMELSGTFGTEETMGGQAKLSAKTTYASDAIKAAIELTYQGDTAGLYYDMTKKNEGDNAVYTAKLHVKATAGVTGGKAIDADIVEATYTYNKRSGDFELKIGLNASALMSGDSVGIIGGGTVKYTASLKGNIKKNGESATITLGSVGAMGVSIDLGVAVTFTKTATAPAIPENAKDILDITQADLEKLMESPIFQIFMAAQPNKNPVVQMMPCTSCGELYPADALDISVDANGIMSAICPGCWEPKN